MTSIKKVDICYFLYLFWARCISVVSMPSFFLPSHSPSRGFNKSRLPTIYRRLQDFLLPPVWISLMKIKIIFKKKFNNNEDANSTTMTANEIFKCYKSSTLFDAQNTGNHISELLDFQIFPGEGGGGHVPRSPQGKWTLRPLQQSLPPITPSAAAYN